MGRLIDVDDLDITTITTDDYSGNEVLDIVLKEDVDNAPTVEAIPKEQYENRLNADMVAMLEDLDLQIDESAAYNLEVAKVQRLIRDRIDKLKGKEDKIIERR